MLCKLLLIIYRDYWWQAFCSRCMAYGNVVVKMEDKFFKSDE